MNIVKMTLLPKVIYIFITISINSLIIFFTGMKKEIKTFIWKNKRLQRGKATLRKMSNARGITITDFKLQYKVTIIKLA
jgi:hypothetical protein